MPLYVYACDTCGHGFEVRQRFGDDPLSVCPECNSRIRRVVQPVGIVFKGSGFYKTDSRSASTAVVPPPAGSADSAPASAGDTNAAPSSAASSEGKSASAAVPASSPPSGGSAKAAEAN